MKILILSDDILPDSGGGAQIMQARLIQVFKQMGHELVVVASVREKNLEGIEEKEGIRIYKFACNYHERWRAYRAIWNPSMVKKLKRVLDKEKPDVVHVHNIHKFFSYWSLKVIKKRGIPLVMTLHDCQPVCYKKFDCFYKKNNP